MVIPPSAIFPYDAKTFDRNGLALRFVDEGQGDPVVMLHGNPTWSFYYRNLIRSLRDTHRCIAPDHIGCGRSDKPSLERYDYSLQSRIDDLTALLDHLEPTRKISLVMHDWGGMIGMGYAVKRPDRIAKLVVLNTAAFPLPASKRFPFALKLGRNTKLGAWLILNRNLFCKRAAKIGMQRRPMPPEVREGLLAPYDSPANRIAVLKFVQTIPLKPSDPGWDLVQSIAAGLNQFAKTPIFIGWGLKDFVFDKHFLAEWLRRFPDAQREVFDDGGHYILEDAAPELIPKIATFLTLKRD